LEALSVLLFFRKWHKRPWITGVPQFIGPCPVVDRAHRRPIGIAVIAQQETINALDTGF
jgi:hypothetical protein